ncbi:serine/threonine-protein kinase [Gemmatimonas sp.]|uniref:serine/threonine-protein kinase n=1 Tax=Gemmatimonas sp. TaxID=1962908 RepID=UPI00286A2EB4|nr:serine/threonine-protein kinase [Gemmatimonas sp.]
MPKVCPVCGTSYPDLNVFCPSDGSTLRAADSDGDLIGSVVADRYLVTDLLGEGGMGKVYLARHVRLPLQAAIKVLRPELLKDAASVARFNREAANASRIEHANVARVFDFGETSDGTVYLAMEYVAGRTLKDVLEKEGPLTLQRTAVLIRQVADGLDAAHRMGIVHRDLKPDNILVTVDENGVDRCKVVDFGIAKAVGGNEKEAGLTRTGFVVGTPEFMSPEQLLGTELDHRSDVYALALVAYTCLTLDLPFDRETPDRGMTARLMSAPRPLAVVRNDLRWPGGLQAVLDQALEREPTKRTSSAGAFAKALEFVTAGPVASAAPAATAPAAAPAPAAKVDTPAARQIATVSRGDIKKELKARGGVVTPPARPSKPVTKPSKPVPVVAVDDDDEPAPRRSVSWPRVRLPSLGFILVVGAGIWFYNKQRAPRVRDVENLVNAATNAGGSLIDGAQSAAASAKEAITSTTTATPKPTPAAGGAPARANTLSGAPAGTSAAPKPAAPTAAPSGASARRSLDSITKALDPLTADEAVARVAIPAIRGLLTRMTTAEDSAWAYIRIAEAHLLMDEVKPACTALRAARGVAQSMSQARVVSDYATKLSCGE